MIERTILWRRLDLPGHDACGLWALAEGWRLAGTAVFSLEGRPCHLAYEVNCDVAWRTRSAQVTGWIGQDAVALAIVSKPGRRWEFNGADQPQAVGCLDVDLGFTPATNLIALRRLALDIGHEADAPAAYLAFPELKLERLEQRYHRLTLDKYDYQAPSVGYVGTLEVSEVGFVTRYPSLWEVVIL
ncbi:MAG: hypothetical protein DPW09_07995 [Anaerolineae bacterium]|nr:hypothetical protein [Anaerolineae bacterium]